MKLSYFGWLCGCIVAAGVGVALAAPAVITRQGNGWVLSNASMEANVDFHDGKLAITRLTNVAAKRDYLAGRPALPLFTHTVAGATCPADDGKWTLTGSQVSPIQYYGKTWGQKLEVTISRAVPVAFSVRQVFELYDGGSLRCLSFVKNGTDKPLTMGGSDILSLNLPNEPHTIHYVTGNVMWNVGDAGVHRNGRNAIAHYNTGDGWFVVPENNWATCIVPGRGKATAREKLLYVYAWDNEGKVRVASNPAAVQLTLFPNEEIEYFSANIGAYKGDAMDGRLAVAEHLRRRFKFINTAPIISVNDWQWGNGWGFSTDANYRNVVVPRAKAAGFDRVLFDDGWYAPDDSTTPKARLADMEKTTRFIVENGLKTGHWFSLQGRFCSRGWGSGRDAADPANIDFKLKQMESELIGKYHSTWDQVDAGLLWKTDTETAYSHPLDSVYRKILGMKRYMNTIAHQYPDFIMQTTCEVDNPGGPGEEGMGAGTHGVGNQNVGLIQLADNGIMGMFKRTEYSDDVRDLFADVGLFPLEGMLSTHGEDGLKGDNGWKDSPMWYYQFLLARHTMIYSWPGSWSPESVTHFRAFNDWRKNPRINALLREVMRPVYNGPDAVKNEGPWCWMFTDEARKQALVFAINHRELNKVQTFDAKLRWLDAKKIYLVEEITQLPDATFNYNFRGEFSGAQLIDKGLPVDLDAGEERCAAFFVQAKAGREPQVLYADATVAKYEHQLSRQALTVRLDGIPGAQATLIVYKPGKDGVEVQQVALDATGKATVIFDATTITEGVSTKTAQAITNNKGTRDTATAGAWRGKYGTLAAWIAGNKTEPANGFSLSAAAPVSVWNKGDADAIPRVLAPPAGMPGPKKAACWTTGEKFSLRVQASAERRYRLSVYVMDYDNGQRGMEMTVKSRDGKIHDRQSATVAETNQGIYLTWDVTGPVTITARKTEGYNAVVSGVFVDSAAETR